MHGIVLDIWIDFLSIFEWNLFSSIQKELMYKISSYFKRNFNLNSIIVATDQVSEILRGIFAIYF